MLMQVMVLELKTLGIRVNGIAPGSILYELQEEADHLRKFGLPEDVAEMALFLLSDASPWLTGQVLVVDGGESLQ